MTELHCDDVERLRSALSYMGYATPEGLENCCARQGDLVRDLIRAVLDQKKRRLEGEQVACACGDSYPNYSYGAGFIDAAGHCSNCHASLPAADDARDGWVAHVSVIDGAFVQPSRHVPDGTYSLFAKEAAMQDSGKVDGK